MKKIMFLTGTRADFGKLKPLIRAVADSGSFEWNIFATGMHMLSRYGMTVEEIYKAGFKKNVYTYMNQVYGEPMEMITANTISGLSRYAQEYSPDLIVVHGDRVEALAGAVVGALRNILVAHIEGGELSGTVDDLIRHSVTKLSHLHFVANESAARRLVQLGEVPDSIFITGSPDIDIMLSDLPELKVVKEYYQIGFENYAIAILHPVTTELREQEHNAKVFVEALIASQRKYVVIYPNNDEGCDSIFHAYERIGENPHIRIFPSLRFEYFLTLLKNADFIIGNSSAGIREAPFYAVPTINIGSRQKGRYEGESIINVDFNINSILQAIEKIKEMTYLEPSHVFGNGKSSEYFMEVLLTDRIWQTPRQKSFNDIKII